MMTQTLPADFICFTDKRDLLNPGDWILDYTPYDKLNLSSLDTDNFHNSFTRNTTPYMRYKFYKMQFYRIPRLRGYDMIVWIDMTRQWAEPNVLENLWHIFEQNPSKQLIMLDHRAPGTRDMKTEVNPSQVAVQDGRWTGTRIGGYPQPYQNIRAQFQCYICDGYTDDYWRQEDLAYRNNDPVGLWRTSFITYRMSDPIVPVFLDRWLVELLKWTTQCQVSLPYVLQKLHLCPYTLPTRDWPNRSFIKWWPHGK
jgi:hypothetical protein